MSIRYDAERKDWGRWGEQDQVFDAFYVAAPLHIAQGTGGPMNPIVIKLGLCPYSDGG
jgi:hypothetical protein